MQLKVLGKMGLWIKLFDVMVIKNRAGRRGQNYREHRPVHPTVLFLVMAVWHEKSQVAGIGQLELVMGH